MRTFISLLFLLIPALTCAESTITCHCFQDRIFNHRDTAAADPYFLATTQNSFISLIYNVDKRNLVKAKMGGESGTHLWILYDVAAHSKQNHNIVDKIYHRSKDWNEVFKELELSRQILGGEYWQLSHNPELLADYIVDQQLINNFSVTKKQLKNWRARGMNRKELILSLLLEGDPVTLYNQVNSGMETWGMLLYNQGLLDGKAINQKLKKQIS